MIGMAETSPRVFDIDIINQEHVILLKHGKPLIEVRRTHSEEYTVENHDTFDLYLTRTQLDAMAVLYLEVDPSICKDYAEVQNLVTIITHYMWRIHGHEVQKALVAVDDIRVNLHAAIGKYGVEHYDCYHDGLSASWARTYTLDQRYSVGVHEFIARIPRYQQP